MNEKLIEAYAENPKQVMKEWIDTKSSIFIEIYWCSLSYAYILLWAKYKKAKKKRMLIGTPIVISTTEYKPPIIIPIIELMETKHDPIIEQVIDKEWFELIQYGRPANFQIFNQNSLWNTPNTSNK